MATDFKFEDDKKIKKETKPIKQKGVDLEDLSSEAKKALINEAVGEVRKDFISTFGIFATLITFVSVQIQIFSRINGVYNLLGISAFTLGGLLLFAIVLNNLSVKEMSQDPLWLQIKRFLSNIGVLLCIIFIIISVYFLYKQERQERHDNFQKIYYKDY